MYLTAQTGENKTDTFGIADFRAPEFKLTGNIPEPVEAQVSVGGYAGGFTFIAEPNETYTALLKNAQGAYIRGGKLQDEWTEYIGRQAEQQQEIAVLKEKYETFRNENKFRSASLMNDSITTMQLNMQKETKAFLQAHDDILAAHAYNLNTLMHEDGLAKTKQAYESLGAKAKNTVSARIMRQRIERMEKTAQGNKAPDFTLADLNGKAVTLSRVKGKIKLIDFWASWCGPCRLNNPALRKLYAEYHPKGLEIIGVSLDEKKDRWLKAVEQDQLPWIQVSSLKGWKCEVARLYNITAVPSIFVLDEENHIIATNLRGEALATFLKDHLK